MNRAFSRKNLWEHTPAPIKAIAGQVLGLLPTRYLIGRRFRSQVAFLQESQWWRADRARDLQLSELRRICTVAYTRTPYYRRLFDAAGLAAGAITFDSLRTLPRLDRDALRSHLRDMCTVPPDSGGVDYVSTGGTSGKPLQFYINASRSQVEFAYLVSGWERAGFRLGMPLAVFRGRVVPRRRSGLRHEVDRALNQHYYSSFHLNDAEVARALDHLRGIGPCFLHGYPSTVEALARYLQRTGTAAPGNILGILAESEILYPRQRGLVEQVFGRRCFSSYGLTEKVAAAAQCERSNDYHLWPSYGYVELLDDEGVPVTTPGARGEITATGFMNTVVPFIRYRTGDYATYVGDRCEACGREHQILNEIRGHRVQETLIAADGSAISWTALNMHDDTFEGVVRFQFYQTQPGRAVLRIVPAAGFTATDRQRIQQRLARKIDGRIDVALELVDAVALSTSGKAIYVDQHIPSAAREAETGVGGPIE